MSHSSPHQPFRLVGVIHLPPLPGSVRGESASAFSTILDRVATDATAYAEGGADALIVENFGDVPFAKDQVSRATIAAITLAADTARKAAGLPIGVNVLRNDVIAAVSIAAMTGASFVRANVYVGAAVTDQGVIQGRADAVQGLIRQLDAPIAVWADIDVKHAAPLAPRPIGELAEDAVERGLAQAVIVSGRGTGKPADERDLVAVRAALGATPIYIGSGATVESIPTLLHYADGVIVGTAAKRDGVVSAPVDLDRVRALVEAAQRRQV